MHEGRECREERESCTSCHLLVLSSVRAGKVLFHCAATPFCFCFFSLFPLWTRKIHSFDWQSLKPFTTNHPSPTSAFTYRFSCSRCDCFYIHIKTLFPFYSLCAWTHRSCTDSLIFLLCLTEVSEGCKILKRCKIARINRFKGARFLRFRGAYSVSRAPLKAKNDRYVKLF